MKIFINTVIVMGLLVGGFFLLSSPSEPTSGTTEDVLSYSQVAAAVTQQDALLLDVRTPEEFAEAHAPEAINFSLQDLQAGKLPSASTDTPIYVYCRSGNRSAQAAQILRSAGYTDVKDLGGLSDIQAIGATLTN